MKITSTSPKSSKFSYVCAQEQCLTDNEDVIDRLLVMRKQEDTTYVCTDYLKTTMSSTMIDELCRSKMLTWCFQVADFGKFNRDTVVIAMSYLDLFLSSGAPQAMDVIKTRKAFQLASMTTLYMAIKLFEPVEMDTTAFAALSRNIYTAQDFVKTEFAILSALNWRINGPTTLSFLEHFFALIPDRSVSCIMIREVLIPICKQYLELTLSDYYFVTQKPSTVAIAVLSASLEHVSLNSFNETERCSLFSDISNALKVELNSSNILSAQKRLATISNEFVSTELKSSHVISFEVKKTHIISPSNSSGSSSPICVSVRAKSEIG